MPAVAVLAALATCAAVPPDAAYTGYIDAGTLGKLACMLLAVGGLGASGAFQALARAVASRCASASALVCCLVGVTALASMLVTNDMALLCLLPLAAACLLAAGRADLIAPTFVLQGLAANLCGMLLPFGNPQNIYLAGAFGVGLGEFVAVMLPAFLASCALVALGCAAVCRRAGKAGARGRASAGVRDRIALRGADPSSSLQVDVEVELEPEGARRSGTRTAPCGGREADSCVPATPVQGRLAACSLAALAGCVLAVVHVLPVWACAAVTLVCVLLGRPALLVRTDWGLVVTFAAFFVFSGNLARVPAVQEAFAGLIDLAGGAFLPGALLSQAISNVPAAIVLSRFTADWPGLLVGVNVGGAGTPVGSLATLIVLAQYGLIARELRGRAASKPRFLAGLVAANMAALAVLLVLGCALGW